MSDFLDPTDPHALEQMLRDALALLGTERLLESLAPVVPVNPGRRRLRGTDPTTVAYGDQVLSIDGRGRAVLEHVVGGVVLSTDPVLPAALAGVLAALVARSVAAQGNPDAAAVLLTALRDAVAAGTG